MRRALFREIDYRLVLSEIMTEKGLSARLVAARARIHASYFSRVMCGNANFSQDQMFQISAVLELDDEARGFLIILRDYADSADHEYRNVLLGKIATYNKEAISAEMRNAIVPLGNLEKSYYYQEAITARIHMHLTLVHYQRDPRLLKARLDINDQKLAAELEKLERLNILERHNNGTVTMRVPVLNLPDSDPLSPQNHINWRLEAIENIKRRQHRPSDYHLSAVFSTDEETKLRIKNLFKDFVIAAQELVSAVRTNEDVHVMSFDLF